MASARHRSSAVPLAGAYTALVLYASLYPFSGWRWPVGLDLPSLLWLPWPPWRVEADLWFNALGYLPLGGLLVLAARRSGWRALPAVALALVLAASLSYACEVAQQFLRSRHPSLKDLAMNAAGAAAGAALALAAQGFGWVDRWHRTRERWFDRDSAGALALLALWPAALLFPTPVPLALGQVADRLRAGLAAVLQDVPWAEGLHALLGEPLASPLPLRPLADAALTALGLLAPVLVAYSVVVPGWRRAALAAGALGLAVAALALSAALNFGPQHALAWVTPSTLPGLAAGLLAAWALAPLPRRLVVGAGLMALSALVVGVAQAPDDPYFAQSLQAWEQGRFVQFHGVTQWLGWGWPFAAMGWLLSRLAKG